MQRNIPENEQFDQGQRLKQFIREEVIRQYMRNGLKSRFARHPQNKKQEPEQKQHQAKQRSQAYLPAD
jgi:hypothetical protein